MVGDVADDRIGHAVDDQSNHDGDTHPPLRQPENLVVIEKQEEREAVVLNAEATDPNP
jgi:hypothetical protein